MPETSTEYAVIGKDGNLYQSSVEKDNKMAREEMHDLANHWNRSAPELEEAQFFRVISRTVTDWKDDKQ